MEKTKQAQQEQQQQQMMMMIMKCPRCDSSNTKFCYYNNYSLSQPRHFCKACKRYWTRGGTLRNVPVGGGCRKNKKQQPIKKTRTTTTSTSANNLDVPISVANPTTSSSTTVLYGLPTHRPSDIGFARLGFSSNDIHSSDSILSNYNNNNNNILSCPNNMGIAQSYAFQRPYLVQGTINSMASKELEKPADDHDPNKLELWVEDDLIVPNSFCQNQMVQINPSIHQHNPSSLYWNPQTTWLDPSALDFSSTT